MQLYIYPGFFSQGLVSYGNGYRKWRFFPTRRVPLECTFKTSLGDALHFIGCIVQAVHARRLCEIAAHFRGKLFPKSLIYHFIPIIWRRSICSLRNLSLFVKRTESRHIDVILYWNHKWNQLDIICLNILNDIIFSFEQDRLFMWLLSNSCIFRNWAINSCDSSYIFYPSH